MHANLKDFINQKTIDRFKKIFAVRYRNNRLEFEDVEDCVIEGFEKLNEAYNPEKGTPDKLLYKIVDNKIRDKLRQARRTESLDAVGPDGEAYEKPGLAVMDDLDERIDMKRLFNRIFSSVRNLTPAEFEVYTLKLGFGLKNEALGRILGKEDGTIRKLASTAKTNFSSRFGIEPEELPGSWDFCFTPEEVASLMGHDSQAVRVLQAWFFEETSTEAVCSKYDVTEDDLDRYLGRLLKAVKEGLVKRKKQEEIPTETADSGLSLLFQEGMLSLMLAGSSES